MTLTVTQLQVLETKLSTALQTPPLLGVHLNTLIALGLSTVKTHPLSAKISVCLRITDVEEKNLRSARRLPEQAFLCIQGCSRLDMVLGSLPS